MVELIRDLIEGKRTGFTVHPDGQEFTPQVGYIVGTENLYIGPMIDDIAELSLLFGKYLGSTLIGAWVEQGTLYIDRVAYYSNYQKAWALGYAKDEMAIYSVHDKKVIWIDNNNPFKLLEEIESASDEHPYVKILCQKIKY